nr:MAG TPA: hypothetical protein [Caudoviricetes sp.]
MLILKNFNCVHNVVPYSFIRWLVTHDTAPKRNRIIQYALPGNVKEHVSIKCYDANIIKVAVKMSHLTKKTYLKSNILYYLFVLGTIFSTFA